MTEDTTRTAAEVFHPGVFIREELRARGWSQAELARRTGLPGGTVRPIVSGLIPISPAVADRLAAALGGTAAYWLNLDWQYRHNMCRQYTWRCLQCGQDMRPQRRTRRYCSVQCQKRAWKRRHRSTTLTEVRRLRAALEQLRDGEVSEQPASPPEEPEPFLYCADCTAFAPVGMELEHKPMFTCGIAQAALAGMEEAAG